MKMNLNQSIKIILAAMLLVFASSSCESLLNVDDQVIIFDDENFQTSNDVNASVLGIYPLLQIVAQEVVLYNELRGDLVKPIHGNASLDELRQGQLTVKNSYLNPRNFYKVIAACNNVLARMGRVRETDPSFTETVFKQYRAEVMALRTWTFFQLSKIIGEVSYYTDAIDYATDDINVTRLNSQSVCQQLLTDLAPVMSDFIVSYSSSVSVDWRIARFNADAAKVLYAELLMYKSAFDPIGFQGNYELAADHLWQVMSKDSFNVSTQNYKVGNLYGGAKWKDVFGPLSSSYNEVILAVDFSKTNEQMQILHDFFTVTPQVEVTEEGMALWTGNDVRKSIAVNQKLVQKYSLLKTVHEADAPIILYRAADVHLLYAEAINRLGETDRAMDIINKGYAISELTPTGEKIMNAASMGIRARVSAGTWSLTGSTPAERMMEAETFILNERARELAFEGKRWEALVRNAILNNRDAIILPTVTVTKDKWYLKY